MFVFYKRLGDAPPPPLRLPPLLQVGVVSLGQQVPLWVRGNLVKLEVTAMKPEGPVARLVLGMDVVVAPRPRLQAGEGVAEGELFGAEPEASSSGPSGSGRGGAADGSPPKAAVLRLQQVTGGSRAQHAKQGAGKQRATLPAQLQPVLISRPTLARCALEEGEWVRILSEDGQHRCVHVHARCRHLGHPSDDEK
jgi:hypothetical protein